MIRLAREADVPAMLAIYAPYVTDTTITFEYEVPTQQAFLERFRKITGENTRSLAFHQKLGYRFAGELKTSGYKFGRWLSVFWLEKQLQIVENPIGFPTKWGGFGQDNQKICDILYNLSLS